MSARFDFSDHRVFITGGSSGIGASLVELFAQAGASVVFTHKTNADAAHTAIQNLQQRFPHQQFGTIFVDLSDSSETAVARSFETALMCLGGRIDIVVNNAADTHYCPFLEISRAGWDHVMHVNVTAPFIIAQSACRLFKSLQISGCIINIGSILGQFSIPNMAAYSASKAALEGLTRSMSVELAQYGVRVNCVNPGLVATANQVSKMPDDELTQFPKFIPQLRLARSEEIASFVLCICSDACSYLNGAIINLDGGLSALQPGPNPIIPFS